MHPHPRIPHSSHQQAAQKRPGFALIIALGLMAFILLLLLSLTAIVQVEGLAADRSVRLQQAREHARLGMLIALGQLQSRAGPDQRITASAELFGAAREKRHWVGVWETETDADSDGRADCLPLGDWLVSKTDSTALNHVTDDLPLAGAALTTAGSEDYALLVGPGSIDALRDDDGAGGAGNGKADDAIVAPRVSVEQEGATAGSYAFWVGDEGRKSKLNAPNRLEAYLGAAPTATEPLQLATTQRFGTSLLNGPDYDLSTYPDGDPTLSSRLLQLSSLPLALGSPLEQDRKRLFHELGTYGHSVLADVRNGGLKWDLSYALDTANAAADEPRTSLASAGLQQVPELLFDPTWHNAIHYLDPGGPRWEQLKSWYNNRLSAGDTLNFAPQRDESHGYQPILTYATLWYHVGYRTRPQLGGLPPLFDIRWYFMPNFVLANPYTHDLQIPDLYVKFEYANAPHFFIQIDGGSIDELSEPTNVGTANQENAGDVQHYVFRIQGTTIPAGEAIIFGRQTNTAYDWGNVDNNVLSPGFTPGAGFYYDAPAFSSLNSRPSDITIYSDAYSDDILLALSTENDFENDSADQPLIFVSHRNQNWGLHILNNAGMVVDGVPDLVTVDGSDLIEVLTGSDSDPLPVPPEFGYIVSLRRPENVLRGATADADDHLNEDNHNLSLPWLTQLNPRANYMSRSPDEWDPPGNDAKKNKEGVWSNPSYCSKYLDQSSGNDYYNFAQIGNNAFWGYSDAATGQLRVGLFDVPSADRPTLSIGELMHYNPSHDFNLEPFKRANWWIYATELNDGTAQSQYLQNNTYPAYAIGSSYADMNLTYSRNQTSYVNDGSLTWMRWNDKYSVTGKQAREGTHYDMSYLLNEALFDRYFFSSIPQAGGALPQPLVLANSRMQPISEGVADSDYRDLKKAAANLLIDGGFNIHSTSVEAWTALLGSFVRTEAPGIGAAAAATQSSFMRVLNPLENFSDGSDALAPEAYAGYRSLTLTEVQTLAQSIVTELKRRGEARAGGPGSTLADTAGGPFGSMADFVNRSTDGTSDMAGLLQRAIDTSGLNDAFFTNDIVDGYAGPPPSESVSYDVELLESYPSSAGAPGYLLQADLLARLGAVMSPRSDTFRIRAYGNALNPVSGAVESEAWCEAIVQRLPDFLSNSQPAETSLPNLSAQEDQDFGRRFRIIEFRWLAQNDV